ncbi:hypothetical protein AYI70_g7281 [Smittium culicis]|uniref:Uncharacterized protein n=1 Tax=Smittium culicis TaxID=133412 RepID=A0A1R1XLC2_9FUNG|nr:hypothetical protein AYI70_g7281 [Smittium culicis]
MSSVCGHLGTNLKNPQNKITDIYSLGIERLFSRKSNSILELNECSINNIQYSYPGVKADLYINFSTANDEKYSLVSPLTIKSILTNEILSNSPKNQIDKNSSLEIKPPTPSVQSMTVCGSLENRSKSDGNENEKQPSCSYKKKANKSSRGSIPFILNSD